MKQFILAAAAATALLTTAATAAPLGVQDIGAQTSGVEQVRMVCDEYGRCYRSRGPRYVQRSYGYGGGYRGYDDGPRYERRGYYGGDGPSIGFSFGGGGGRW